MEPLLDQEVDEFGHHEVVLVDHIDRRAVVQGPAGCQQLPQETAAPAGGSAREHLLELHLCRGLLDLRLASQRVHDRGGLGVVDGHRSQDHVAVTAVELISVVARLIDGNPPAGPSPVIGGFLAVAAAEVCAEQTGSGVRRSAHGRV
ncbi:hypothetical protein [Streptomyces sp. NPDC005548]|uniref:hypothetical protein n=1 Tax=Streptomyces sp. NPDC005548 TaxID=3364724 RepID=UPI0036C6A276